MIGVAQQCAKDRNGFEFNENPNARIAARPCFHIGLCFCSPPSALGSTAYLPVEGPFQDVFKTSGEIVHEQMASLYLASQWAGG